MKTFNGWTYCDDLGPETSIPELDGVPGFTFETVDEFYYCTFDIDVATDHQVMHVGSQEYHGTLEELKKIIEGFNSDDGSESPVTGNENMPIGWM